MQILPFNYQNQMNNIQYNNKRTTNSPSFKATMSADEIRDTLKALEDNNSPKAEAIARKILNEVSPQRGRGTSVVISDSLAIEMATALLEVAADALQKQNSQAGVSSSEEDVDNSFGRDWQRYYESCSTNTVSNSTQLNYHCSSGGTGHPRYHSNNCNPNTGGRLELQEPGCSYKKILTSKDVDHVEPLTNGWSRVYRNGSGKKYNDVHASASEVREMLKGGSHRVETDSYL